MTRRHKLLRAVQKHFAELGFPAEFVEDDNVRSLFVGVPPDAQGRPRFVSLAFVPGTLGSLRSLLLFQLYSPMPCRFDSERRDELERYLTAANARLAIGHFGFSESDGVFLRHVEALPLRRPLGVSETAELIGLFTFMQDLCGEAIEAVATGAIGLDDALATLAPASR